MRKSIFFAAILPPHLLHAAPPAWWSDSATPVLEQGATAHDFSPVTLGQLKNVATQANRYLDSALLAGGGSGGSIDIICQFTQADNYAPANLGQLKHVAKAFYDRLENIHFDWETGQLGTATSRYPWTATVTAFNSAPCTLGQLKRLFSFELSPEFLNKDNDADGLPDWWEYAFFHTPNTNSSTGDYDGDDLNNLQEYLQQTNPKAKDTDGDGQDDNVDSVFDSPAIWLEVRYLDTFSAWKKFAPLSSPVYYENARWVKAVDRPTGNSSAEWTESWPISSIDPGIEYNRSGILLAAAGSEEVNPTNWSSFPIDPPTVPLALQCEVRTSIYYGGPVISGVLRTENISGVRLKSSRPCAREETRTFTLLKRWKKIESHQWPNNVIIITPGEDTQGIDLVPEKLINFTLTIPTGSSESCPNEDWGERIPHNDTATDDEWLVASTPPAATPAIPNQATLAEVQWNLPRIEILANTNRDVDSAGSDLINDDDLSHKDTWSKSRGAIYNVNFDRDNLQPPEADDWAPGGFADAITWLKSEGSCVQENWVIENAEDCKDITPFLIRIGQLPPNVKVYLVAGEQEDLHAVHIFPRIKSGQEAIWGEFEINDSFTAPWSDSAGSILDIEITNYLRPQEDEAGYLPSASGTVQGTYVFGLEGLVFRGMVIPEGTLPDSPGKFSGIIDLGLEVEIPGQPRKKAGAIRLKVAPFLLTPNDRATQHVHVADEGFGLATMSTKTNNVPSSPNQFVQDHVEIGHTQRPGGQPITTTLIAPINSFTPLHNLPLWPQQHLYGPNKGVFAIGIASEVPGPHGSVSGNAGGNIELSPPRIGYPLGRIIAGNRMGAKLQEFLKAQEVQEPIFLDISYTDVQHIDEVMSPGPAGITYIPGPAEAIALLNEKFSNDALKLQGVFFSTDTQAPFETQPLPESEPSKTATVHSSSSSSVTLNLSYSAQIAADWLPFKYVRIVADSNAGGQVAQIQSYSNQNGRLCLHIGTAWRTTLTNPGANQRASQNWNIINGDPQSTWHTLPTSGLTLVAVKGSLFWAQGCPAIITVKEVLADTDFIAFNSDYMHEKIANATATVAGNNALSVPTASLPCLFFKGERQEPGGNNIVLYSIAFTPNAANLQWVDSIPFHPEPFGPRTPAGLDVIRDAIRAASPLPIASAKFVPAWFNFHFKSGEVHCASAAERDAEPSWWARKFPK